MWAQSWPWLRHPRLRVPVAVDASRRFCGARYPQTARWWERNGGARVRVGHGRGDGLLRTASKVRPGRVSRCEEAAGSVCDTGGPLCAPAHVTVSVHRTTASRLPQPSSDPASGVGAFIKGTWQSPLPLRPGRAQGEVCGLDESPRPTAPAPRLPASGAVRNEFPVFISRPACGAFVIAAETDSKNGHFLNCSLTRLVYWSASRQQIVSPV